MKYRLSIIFFWICTIILVIFTGFIVFRLMVVPYCVATKNAPCPVVDGWSIAGFAATVMGVAAAILALLGAFAVAAWWTGLDNRITTQVKDLVNTLVPDIFTKQFAPDVDKKVNDLILIQSVKVDDQVKALQDNLVEVRQNLQKFSYTQDNTLQQIDAASRALLYFVLGSQLLAEKKFSAAIEMLQKAKQFQPDDVQVNYALGRVYNDIGAYQQAIQCLETAIARDKDFPQAHYELGMAYRNRADKLYSGPGQKQQYDEDYNKAIEHLKEATHLLPSDEEIVATLGGTYRRYKKYPEALEAYKQALILNPDSSYALGNITLLLWHEGQLDEARKAFKQTEDLATKRIDAKISYEPCWDYYDRAMSRLALGQKADALDDYRKAISLTYNPDIFKSVLSGIFFLKEVEGKYPMDGLNDVLSLIQTALAEAEKKIVKSA